MPINRIKPCVWHCGTFSPYIYTSIIETQLFKECLTLEFDYYYEKTIDLVNDVSLSNTSGFSTYKNNMGEVENKGIELTARYDAIKNKSWLVAFW